MANESGATDLSSLREQFKADQEEGVKSPGPTDAEIRAEYEYEALTDEEKETLARLATQSGETGEPEPEATGVRTAFLVIVNNEGETFASLDLDLKLSRSYIPTHDDIYAAAANVQRDILSQLTAQHTIIGMQQAAQAMQRQQQEQMMAQHLASKNLRAPGN